MRFSFTTQPATFLERPNRYRVMARLWENGELIHAHCPDPGRLLELLTPGVTVHVSPAQHTERKTAYDLRFVEHPVHGQLISLDTRLPNQLVGEGLAQNFFAPFRHWQSLRREVSVPHGDADASASITSRIDFHLIDAEGRPCWLEVKSVTLVNDGEACFPDAPTLRGQRHLVELTHLVQSGERAAVLFIVQRPDAHVLYPNWTTDADFAQTLVSAQQAGVEIYAYTCTLTTVEARLAVPIAVRLERR
jgi:sugar fermentation stimulation protein A